MWRGFKDAYNDAPMAAAAMLTVWAIGAFLTAALMAMHLVWR
jgi:hypothetical protein